jgi:hypothetical protein
MVVVVQTRTEAACIQLAQWWLPCRRPRSPAAHLHRRPSPRPLPRHRHHRAALKRLRRSSPRPTPLRSRLRMTTLKSPRTTTARRPAGCAKRSPVTFIRHRTNRPRPFHHQQTGNLRFLLSRPQDRSALRPDPRSKLNVLCRSSPCRPLRSLLARCGICTRQIDTTRHNTTQHDTWDGQDKI